MLVHSSCNYCISWIDGLEVKGSEADQPTLPLSLPGSAVHLVVDDTSLRLLEGVLRERLMVQMVKVCDG